MKSKAFENFIQDRCEEILENDSHAPCGRVD